MFTYDSAKRARLIVVVISEVTLYSYMRDEGCVMKGHPVRLSEEQRARRPCLASVVAHLR